MVHGPAGSISPSEQESVLLEGGRSRINSKIDKTFSQRPKASSSWASTALEKDTESTMKCPPPVCDTGHSNTDFGDRPESGVNPKVGGTSWD